MHRAVFPLGTTFLPYEDVILRVFEDRYVALLNHVRSHDNVFVSVLIAQGSEVGGGDKRFSYGVEIEVVNIAQSDLGFMLHGVAQRRIKIEQWGQDNPYPHADVVYLTDDEPSESQRHNAASSISLLAQNVKTLRERILGANTAHVGPEENSPQLNTLAAGRWWSQGVSLTEVERAFWLLAAHVPCGPMDRYDLLQPNSLLERVSRLRYIVEHVTEILDFQQQK